MKLCKVIVVGAILVASLLASSCATCERHPIACTAAGAFIATSIALGARGHGATPFPDRRFHNPTQVRP